MAVSAGASRGQCLYSQVPTEPRFTDLSEAAAKSGSCSVASVSCVHPSKRWLIFPLQDFHVVILQNKLPFLYFQRDYFLLH